MGPLVAGLVEPLGLLEQGLLETSGVRVAGHLKQGLVSIAPKLLIQFPILKAISKMGELCNF